MSKGFLAAVAVLVGAVTWPKGTRAGASTLAVMGVLVLACGDTVVSPGGGSGGGSGAGSIQVSVSTSGTGTDPSGYTVNAGGQSQSISTDGSVTIADLVPNSYDVSLAAVSGNCTIDGAITQSIQVSTGGVTPVSFDVRCAGRLMYTIWNSNFDIEFMYVGFDGSLVNLSNDPARLVNLSNDPARDTHGTWSPDGSRIAFWREASTFQAMYVVNADGSGLNELTRDGGLGTLLWSPDGSQIAYSRAQDLYIIPAAGGVPVNITGTGANFGFAWSPNGTRIVFSSNRSNNEDIYTVAPDGSQLTLLTINPARDKDPISSPDGSQIAFVSDRDGVFGIYIINAGGGGLRAVTTNTVDFPKDLRWSPDGSRIAFDSRQDGNPAAQCRFDIYSVASDGSGLVKLSQNAGLDCPSWHRWSPDGAQIIFASGPDDISDRDIYVVNPDGTGLQKLTNESANFRPHWSPAGSQIAFSSRRDGKHDIFVMDPDGSNVIKITHNAVGGGAVRWQP